MKQWKTLAREPVLEGNRYLCVERHTIELPDGRMIENWPWVIMPDYVNVVAVNEEKQFLCFRQTKYAIEGTSLAPVGGYIDSGESALAAAQRELLEETGYAAEEWTQLGSFPVDANRGCGVGNFFLARGARKAAQPKQDDLEEQTLLLLTREEVESALGRGEFRILSWAMARLLALRFLDPGQKKQPVEH